ncbi:MAG: aminotransferase class I/II-fold pyridoxal phosphate-dependent enzyme [candidate division Zixibacteria bacterium]|nr:aminotransferase class I/II-fold pyridoxal phosphate-dependent enzyme [candidate division Zixibacteria bacterium]
MKIIDLRSDTITHPSEGMRKAIFQAEVGDDVFGDDPTVVKLQEMTAELLGKSASLYFPSGTMSNQVGLRCLTSAGDEAVIEKNAHIFRYECGSASAMSGIQLNTIAGTHGVITREQIEEAIRPDDEHQPPTKLVCLENTHNKAGGTIFPFDEIVRIRELCLRRNIHTYLDGARLWNASAATGIPLPDYAAQFDLVSVCLSKGLGAPVGSVLAGDIDTINQARRFRKAFGGGMRQVGILAAAGIYALEHNLNRLIEDHHRAEKLAETIAEIPKIDIDLDSVQTNIVIFDVKNTGIDPQVIEDELAAEGVLIVSMGGTLLRAVCHLDVDDEDIDRAGKVISDYFTGGSL